LSNAIIDWNKSKLEKDFFINKFHSILEILSNSYNVEWEIYEGSNPVGHLDVEKKLFERYSEFDGILSLCPDVHFHETLLSSMFSAFEAVNNEFVVITPQTHRLWDKNWDEMVNDQCENLDYENYKQIDVYDVEWITEMNLNNISTYEIKNYRWSGWCDLRSSKLVELFPPPKSWTGYGPYDTYLMVVLKNYNKINKWFDFKQYCIKNQVIGKYSNHNFKNFYKEYLVFNDIKGDKRAKYESELLKIAYEEIQLKLNKIIIMK